MRLAYVVDVHGRFGAVAEAVTSVGRVDLLIVGGDLTNAGSADDAERAIQSWRPLAASLLAVAGNMDSPEIDARLVELGVSIDGRGTVIDGVGVFGVSAAPFSPLHTPYEAAEDELERRIEAGFAGVAGARVLVFCPHAPPRGTACDRLRSGRHVGSEVVRSFVDREQPDLVLCGHIHESRGVDEVGRSRIVNPGPVAAGHHAVVELDGGGVEVRLD